MSLDRDRLIVLRKIPYRESDLIVRGLNVQGAKVSYLAPAALKSRRRFGGGLLEPTHFIEVIYQSGRKTQGSLVRVQEAQLLKEFQGLRQSYERIQAALSLLGLVDQVGQEGDLQGEDLFNLLGHSLQYLSQSMEFSLPLFRLQFLLKFLHQQGVLDRESWMDLFLQVSIRDHHRLASALLQESLGPELMNGYLDRLIQTEHLVQSYCETGATSSKSLTLPK